MFNAWQHLIQVSQDDIDDDMVSLYHGFVKGSPYLPQNRFGQGTFCRSCVIDGFSIQPCLSLLLWNNFEFIGDGKIRNETSFYARYDFFLASSHLSIILRHFFFFYCRECRLLPMETSKKLYRYTVLKYDTWRNLNHFLDWKEKN